MVNILRVNLPQTCGKIDNGALKDKVKATLAQLAKCNKSRNEGKNFGFGI